MAEQGVNTGQRAVAPAREPLPQGGSRPAIALAAGGAVLAAALTTAMVLLVSPHPLGTRAAFLLALIGLSAASARFDQDLYGSGFASVGAVPVIAAGVLCGPVAIPIIELVVTCGRDLARRSFGTFTVYNVSMFTISGVVGASVLLAVQRLAPGPWLFLFAGGLAGVAYYVVNAVLVSLGISVLEARPVRQVFRENIAWLAPHYVLFGILAAGLVLGAEALGVLGLAVFAMPAIAMAVATAQYLRRTTAMVADLQEANRTLEELLAENRGLLASLGREHLALIGGLANAIDAKDPYTAGHTSRVAAYALALAVDLGLDEERRREIEQGALLHDIGKIGVPDAILSKPGPLNQDEWREMRRHPELACQILEGTDLPPTTLSVVRNHHENIDGSGYPDRLAGEAISLPARIARVADAFDAMTSDRPYRDALSIAAARAELRRCAGTQFCPDVVAAFERLLDSGSLRETLAGRPASDLARTA
jgi:putative nucleotidyltransferase with HDIG domain